MPTQQQRLRQSTKSAGFRSGDKTPLSERRRRWIRLADLQLPGEPKPTLPHNEYDPYGQVTQTVGSLASDFQYAGYYFHAPSGLNLTLTRAYSPTLGRWINRDPIGEDGGTNLYAYVDNEPIQATDPYGLQAVQGAIIGGAIIGGAAIIASTQVGKGSNGTCCMSGGSSGGSSGGGSLGGRSGFITRALINAAIRAFTPCGQQWLKDMEKCNCDYESAKTVHPSLIAETKKVLCEAQAELDYGLCILGKSK
jgi:RHS repeat-associated protein